MAHMTLLRVVIILSGTLASALIAAPRPSSSRQHPRFNSLFSIRPISVLHATPNDDDTEKESSDSQSDDGAMNLDQQKLALENMLKDGSGRTDAKPNKNPSILTTSRKQRLEREIQLLKQLDPEHPEHNIEFTDVQNQEFVVTELWSLWYGERGPLNERFLLEAEESLGDVSQWPRAEQKYLSMIREHCSTDGSMDNLNLSNWVEPANRLATLLFLMGRLKESKQWCEQILSVKPWHMGALSGVVMVCIKMGDKEGVLKYSLMGMPNLSLQMRNDRQGVGEKKCPAGGGEFAAIRGIE
mmetsp:Transcript_20908/g.45335  ORF Transcript_20908/g.45335 Transcript_20908/m.45335 type:complete len:298 (-) Transcript_20908:614-1507(-)